MFVSLLCASLKMWILNENSCRMHCRKSSICGLVKLQEMGTGLGVYGSWSGRICHYKWVIRETKN